MDGDHPDHPALSRSTWRMWLFALLCAVIAALGLGFCFLQTFPERSSLTVVEGDLVVDSVALDGGQLLLRLEGYGRELIMSHPEERIPAVAERLERPLRLRALVEERAVAGLASLIELEALGDPGGVILTYDEVAAWHLQNGRLAAAVGMFFGLCTLGTLLLIRSRGDPGANLVLPETGKISQDLFVSWPNVLVLFGVCACMTALFAWGLTQWEREPLLAVVSVPMGALFLFTCLGMLPWLVPGRAILTIDEEGIVEGPLGHRRIPWDRITDQWLQEESGMTFLCLEVTDADELVRSSNLVARLNAWGNKTSELPPISVCLFPLAASNTEVLQILASHGRTVRERLD